MECFSDRLRYLMEREHVSVRYLADCIGVDPVTIYRWRDYGSSSPNIQQAIKICEILNTSADFLLLGK